MVTDSVSKQAQHRPSGKDKAYFGGRWCELKGRSPRISVLGLAAKDEPFTFVVTGRKCITAFVKIWNDGRFRSCTANTLYTDEAAEHTITVAVCKFLRSNRMAMTDEENALCDSVET